MAPDPGGELYKIRAETQADFAGIRLLYNATLGDDEAVLVDRLREDRAFSPGMSLVAASGDVVVGHILFSNLKLAGRNGNKIQGACLAPMAVMPPVQKMGIGTALVEAGLKALPELGYAAVVVLGDTEYYSRFGFSVELAKKIQSRYCGPRLMALELVKGALSLEKKVAAVYPKAFSRMGSD